MSQIRHRSQSLTPIRISADARLGLKQAERRRRQCAGLWWEKEWVQAARCMESHSVTLYPIGVRNVGRLLQRGRRPQRSVAGEVSIGCAISQEIAIISLLSLTGTSRGGFTLLFQIQ